MDVPKKKRNNAIYFLCAALLLYGILLFSISGYPSIREANENKDLPDETFGMTSESFYGFLDKIGESERQNYLIFESMDYVNAFLLGAVLFIALSMLLKRANAGIVLRSVLVFPVAMLVFDLLENTSFIILTLNFPNQMVQLANASGFFTNAKLVFGSFGFLSLILCVIFVIVKAIMGGLKES